MFVFFIQKITAKFFLEIIRQMLLSISLKFILFNHACRSLDDFTEPIGNHRTHVTFIDSRVISMQILRQTSKCCFRTFIYTFYKIFWSKPIND